MDLKFKTRNPSYLRKKKNLKKNVILHWLKDAGIVGIIINIILVVIAYDANNLTRKAIKQNNIDEDKKFKFDSTYAGKKYRNDSIQLSKQIELLTIQYKIENEPNLVLTSVDKITFPYDSLFKSYSINIQYTISNLGKMPVQIITRESEIKYPSLPSLKMESFSDSDVQSDVVTNGQITSINAKLDIPSGKEFYLKNPFEKMGTIFQEKITYINLINEKEIKEFEFIIVISNNYPIKYKILGAVNSHYKKK